MRLFRRSSSRGEGEDRFVIVGLGNPGAKYERTRHNAGAMVLDVLLERTGGSLKRHKSGCLVAETDLAGERCVFARSTSYMNESGGPIGKLMRWYKASPDHLVVIHDEIDLPFGDVRVKFAGGVAGHNGLKSVASHLGTQSFIRIRIGVSRPRGRKDAADHVLDEFTSQERKELPVLFERAADAAEMVVAKGVERAMNEVNTRT